MVKTFLMLEFKLISHAYKKDESDKANYKGIQRNLIHVSEVEC